MFLENGVVIGYYSWIIANQARGCAFGELCNCVPQCHLKGDVRPWMSTHNPKWSLTPRMYPHRQFKSVGEVKILSMGSDHSWKVTGLSAPQGLQQPNREGQGGHEWPKQLEDETGSGGG
jgi:hypothetical protein